ncbi:efflux RND transporter periplasmic adaptor subunit, partial [Mesorhizobium sp. M8A.F.Ca.ET.197.01.1.1]
MSLSSSILHRLPVAGFPAVGLIVAALGLAGCSQEKAAVVQEVVRPVKVVEIGKAETTRQLDYSGSVRARTEMNLGFRIAGK